MWENVRLQFAPALDLASGVGVVRRVDTNARCEAAFNHYMNRKVAYVVVNQSRETEL